MVWGCKPPELLLTEAVAFHDRRVADTVWDDGPKRKRTDTDTSPGVAADPTLDQTRIPQGSAFFEVYCPRNPRNSAAPTDLYVQDANPLNASEKIWKLNLSQLAKEPTVAGGSTFYYPVWRMVISKTPAHGNGRRA